ncbi:hypothetical protein AX14_003342 [Amanita brunnescens Koide BX004]|nr:hypothetical protein AX14_003342 [Amanita brunnescens Koide BX004]
MAGLAEIWSDAAEFDARAALHDMIEGIRLLPKAKVEIDRLEGVAARYRNERNVARTQLKTNENKLSRLRQATNDTLDSNARLLTKIDQLQATDAVVIARERDEARTALKDAIDHSKSAMAKQVARYQQLASIAEERNSRLHELEKDAADKDAYILKTEREHAEIYRERESAERLVTALKHQLQEATSLFETTREARRHDQEDFDSRVVAFQERIGELNTRLNLLPSGEAELRSMVTLANERAGIAEEEYRKKSTELKLVHKELTALKAKQTDRVKPEKAPTNSQAQKIETKEQTLPSTKKVRWSFEPDNDSSQPFWDHTNEYSRYIANMVAATVSAIPNIPMQTAISTAIETVRAAGPTILSQPQPTPKSSTDAKRPTSPGPKRPSSPSAVSSSTPTPRRSRAPSPSAPKSAPAPVDANPVGSMMFAQMAATVLNPPTAAAIHPAKAKPTWRAIETNKSLVLRPGTKGTRVSELHIRVPKVPATAHLFSLSGTKLINEVLRLVNDSHNKAGIRTLRDNHLVLVKWSMRGNLIFKCSKLMDDVVKECLHDAIKATVPPSSLDSIAILNKLPTTALKFSSVPRHNKDGTDTDSYGLLNDLMGNELWRDVEVFSQPRFLPMKPDAAGGTVIVSVVDDNVGSIGRKLMNTVVNFSGASRRCLCWVEKEAQLHCTQCQGVPAPTTIVSMIDFVKHARQVKAIYASLNVSIAEAHISPTARNAKERQVQLWDEFSQKWKEEEAALKAAANSDSGRAARVAIAAKDTRGKGKTKAQTGRLNDDDDYVPVGKGGKAKYTFGGMSRSLAPTTRIDEVVGETKNSNDKDSDTSSELRLSYIDDMPLKQRFPSLKLPAPSTSATVPSSKKAVAQTPKPLTITLPATGHKPLRSVTDVLRELKNPTTATAATETAVSSSAPAPAQVIEIHAGARFGGGEVEYSASALKSEASAFAAALATADVPSQPSPPMTSELMASATLPHSLTTPHD